MHKQVQAFVDSAVEAFQLKGPVYQFGFSRRGDSGGWASLPESLSEAGYVGFEWGDGAELGRLPFSDGAARTVLCIDTLGYAFEPRRAVEEMARILAPGGALLVCASVAGPAAEEAPAYWRLTPQAVERLLAGMEGRLVGWQGGDAFPHTVYGVGFKPPLGGTILEGTRRFLDRFQARLREAAGPVGWRQRLKHVVAGWARSRLQRREGRDYSQLQLAVHFSVDRNLEHKLLQSCLPDERIGTRLDIIE
jgi:SAM-dependent methyltransferase